VTETTFPLPAAADSPLLDRARDLVPLVLDQADESERLGTMPKPVVDAIRGAGLFGMLVPSDLGGAETGAATTLAIFEELTAADASIGWSYMANASTGAFSAFLGDSAVATMFADGPSTVLAGQFSPRGPALPVDGGYRVNGNYSFGSGSGHADWIGGGTIQMDGDSIAMQDGRPIIRAFFVPRAEVEITGNWDVMGLVGTGSYDYTVTERVVPADFTFEITNPIPRRGGPIFGMGVLGLTASGHAGYALGVGRRALQEIVPLARRKQRLGHAGPVATNERFLYELGQHDAMFRSARSYVFSVFMEAEAQLRSGAPLTAWQTAALRQATTHATHVARDVVTFAYHWSGADGLRPGVLQRLFRDTYASTQHIFVDDSTLTEAGRVLCADVENGVSATSGG
jgi:alkylation response protein AidB-like acyl-CoA dehydrogenase